MTEATAIRRAAKILQAKRLGLPNPDKTFKSMDAVLMVLCPDYSTSFDHRMRWRRLKDMAFEKADRMDAKRKCACGKSLTYHQKIHCSRECEAKYPSEQRHCPSCTRPLVRSKDERLDRWNRRRYCERQACKNEGRRGQRQYRS